MERFGLVLLIVFEMRDPPRLGLGLPAWSNLKSIGRSHRWDWWPGRVRAAGSRCLMFVQPSTGYYSRSAHMAMAMQVPVSYCRQGEWKDQRSWCGDERMSKVDFAGGLYYDTTYLPG